MKRIDKIGLVCYSINMKTQTKTGKRWLESSQSASEEWTGLYKAELELERLQEKFPGQDELSDDMEMAEIFWAVKERIRNAKETARQYNDETKELRIKLENE